jgi:fused signal recognition particle receptor
MIAAGDTFRAGAIEQLKRWSERVGCDFAGSEPGRDPAAVAFDAVEEAERLGVDVLIIDTAGRLHTQHGLMQELEKVQRVIARKLPGAPHERLLVLDGTVGQNAMAQVRTFGQTVSTSPADPHQDGQHRQGRDRRRPQEGVRPPGEVRRRGRGIDDLLPFEIEAFAEEVLTE